MKMNSFKIILVLILFFLTTMFFPSFGQTIEWEINVGGSENDYVKFIQQTNEGGYIVVGSSISTDGDVSNNHGNFDYWIVSLDQNGNIVWEKSIGGTGFDSPKYVEQTSDGGYIVCGDSKSNDGDVGGNNGSYDYWVVKLDAEGEILWEKNYGGSNGDYAWSVRQTIDGGYIVSGYSASSDGDVSDNNGGADYWILRLDNSGEIIWNKNLGGSGSDLARYIQESSDGGYIVAGFSTSNDGDVSGNNGGADYWIVKLDNNGEITWEKSLGGSNDEIGWTVEEVLSGGYIVCGYSSSNDGDIEENNGLSDYWIVRLDSEGEIIWEKNYGGHENEYANSIKQTVDGGFIVAGNSESNGSGDVENNNGGSDYWIIKIDEEGEILWQKNLGGTNTDGVWAIQQTIDEGYIIAGFSESNDIDVGGNNGAADYWIVKLSSSTSNTSITNELKEITIQPNPSTGSYSIESNLACKSFEIDIYNSIGKIIYTQKNFSNQFSLQGVPKGIYTLVISCDSTLYSSLLLLK